MYELITAHYFKNNTYQAFVTKVFMCLLLSEMGFPPCYIWADKGGDFQKFPYVSETLHKTSEGLGELFEGDFADTCTRTFLLIMGD